MLSFAPPPPKGLELSLPVSTTKLTEHVSGQTAIYIFSYLQSSSQGCCRRDRSPGFKFCPQGTKSTVHFPHCAQAGRCGQAIARELQGAGTEQPTSVEIYLVTLVEQNPHDSGFRDCCARQPAVHGGHSIITVENEGRGTRKRESVAIAWSPLAGAGGRKAGDRGPGLQGSRPFPGEPWGPLSCLWLAVTRPWVELSGPWDAEAPEEVGAERAHFSSGSYQCTEVASWFGGPS